MYVCVCLSGDAYLTPCVTLCVCMCECVYVIMAGILCVYVCMLKSKCFYLIHTHTYVYLQQHLSLSDDGRRQTTLFLVAQRIICLHDIAQLEGDVILASVCMYVCMYVCIYIHVYTGPM